MRFGLLGTGNWAEHTHAVALDAHPRAELVGVWGRRPPAAAAVAERFGIRPYADADALLADCDAVAIALPPDVQAPLAVRAAEAGCALLLDKPLATSVDGARQVVDAVERAGVASVVFFTLRFTPASARWIAEQFMTGGWFTGRADWYSPVFGGADTPNAASPWRREKGALWDVGPHALSVLLPVLGDVERDLERGVERGVERGEEGGGEDEVAGDVGGKGGRGGAGGLAGVAAARGPGDTVHLALRHTSGASSTVTVTLSAPPAASGVVAELRGTRGVATLPERDIPASEALGRAVDALLSGEPHPCDARFALRVTEILAAAEDRLG